MRTVLMCHSDDAFDRQGLAAWLSSFSELAGLVLIEETGEQKRARVRRELKRVGPWRFLDVLAMRFYYRVRLAAADHAWMDASLAGLRARFGIVAGVPELRVASANAPEVAAFLAACQPDVMIARSKQLLSKKIFRIPTQGCLVMHPGICPEYRNAHGCFWALAERDLDRVGLTLLRIDAGVDTGPVYGHFTYAFDEANESHVRVQYRMVLENLDALAQRIRDIAAGDARPVDVTGRQSGTWGQPLLSRYLRWKRAALDRQTATATAE
ncbi:Formyl transferase [Luteibacter sp. UNCMF331Sha3.1]|uniref:formyltransferase family protein n=1 Tax=Luteibacter sp. UNCMF331Sha3.1 TaxID=1502760 RepID=UPI0008C1D781|nr:formyltransferase family protein [Luteibacter sp. UNCMF331Sha3.1]SEN18292.1 Formyl transferase [Luteibacter sp. UNCMF331Sha3.1]